MGQNAIYYKGKSYTGGGGGGGSSTLVDLTDVNIDNPTGGQGLVYDATNQKWINGNVGGGTATYKETVLWEGCANSGSYTLDTPITNFDAVIAYGLGYMGSNLANSNLIIPVFISVVNIEYNMQYMANGSWSAERRAYIIFTDSTHFSLGINGGTAGFYKVTGVNFGGGSGGAIFEGLDYENAETLNLPDTTGYNYTPSQNGALLITGYGSATVGIHWGTSNFMSLKPYGDTFSTVWVFVEKDITYNLSKGGGSGSSFGSDSVLSFIPLKQSSSGNGGSSEVNYSTEEQRIGTWIDEKPIYQKTYAVNSITIPNTGIVIESYIDNLSNIQQFIKAEAQGTTDKSCSGLWVGMDRNQLRAYCSEGTTCDYITLQYTKTTD